MQKPSFLRDHFEAKRLFNKGKTMINARKEKHKKEREKERKKERKKNNCTVQVEKGEVEKKKDRRSRGVNTILKTTRGAELSSSVTTSTLR